jgi:hypothetical protein
MVLCGLTTSGSILGSVRLGADLDFHIIVPREEVMNDEEYVNDFLLERIFPKSVDLVGLKNCSSSDLQGSVVSRL